MMQIKLFFYVTILCLLLGCENKSSEQQNIESNLEVLSIDTKERKIIYSAKQHFEAPNWSMDGNFFVFNSEGKIYTLPVTGGEPQLLNTDFAQHCSSNHGLSPDSSLLAITHQDEKSGKSIIYTVPLTGGQPKQITSGASYWHSWSPDGKTIAYRAERNEEFDIYTISVDGGEENRLTNAPGLDDGPDFTADGESIYFNSERTGAMKIWKMNVDGSRKKQVTFDEYNDWFPHPSPDGKWLIFLSYEKDVEGHPANKEVMLRMMPLIGGKPKIVAKFLGGQGTINVPSWSPDSKQVAFVSYRLLK